MLAAEGAGLPRENGWNKDGGKTPGLLSTTHTHILQAKILGKVPATTSRNLACASRTRGL